MPGNFQSSDPTGPATTAADLATLHSYDVLDTPPEQGFDDVVMLASQICGAPAAIVSLFDADRQWFKARVGVEQAQIPLDQSICAHALTGPDVVVIPDLTADERTTGNHHVTKGYWFRFYAGAPLIAPGGQILGALCVLDTDPKPEGLMPPQVAGLAALARQVVDLLELRRIAAERKAAANALRASEAKWRGLFQNLREGFILGEVIRDDTGRVVDWRYVEVNAAWGDLLGISIDQVAGQTIRQVIPGIEDHWITEIGQVVETGRALRFRRQVGACRRWYDGVCEPAGGDRFTVMFLEVTDSIRTGEALRSSQDRYRTLVENVDVGICIVEMKFDDSGRAIDYRIAEGNEAYERHTGLYGSVGRWVSDVAPGLERHWFDVYGQVALTGEPARFISGSEALDGRWFEVQAHRVGAAEDRHVAILFTDITERRKAEEERQIVSAELAHRLKNTLTLVQVIANQSLRQAKSVQEGGQAISERLAALARAQDLMVDAPREGAGLGEVVAAAIAPHQTGDARIQIGGPEVALTPQQAFGLTLAIHELATNATKYGALSNATGHVDIQWQIDGPGLNFTWQESGGPVVVAPDRRGFGSSLIENVVGPYFDGTGKIDYAAPGLRFELAGRVGSKA